MKELPKTVIIKMNRMNKTERIIAMIDMYCNEMKKTVIGILKEDEDEDDGKIDMKILKLFMNDKLVTKEENETNVTNESHNKEKKKKILVRDMLLGEGDGNKKETETDTNPDDDVSTITSSSQPEKRGRKSKTCIHSTDGKMCVECLRNIDRCEHGKNKYACRECGTGLCEHQKFRNSCRICKPKK
jgi:hypothetical protein